MKNNKEELSELRKRLWKIAGAGGAIGTAAALILKGLEFLSGGRLVMLRKKEQVEGREGAQFADASGLCLRVSFGLNFHQGAE